MVLPITILAKGLTCTSVIVKHDEKFANICTAMLRIIHHRVTCMMPQWLHDSGKQPNMKFGILKFEFSLYSA